MKIAIQGNSTRGHEVIKILEGFGGINIHNYSGLSTFKHYIDSFNKINITTHLTSDWKIYTLEEFEKEFPFKIGDLCTYSSDILDEDIVVKILGMAIKDNCVVYEVGHKDNTNGHSYIYRKETL